jgi:exodeoxyribonuclease V alpha subunit
MNPSTQTNQSSREKLLALVAKMRAEKASSQTGTTDVLSRTPTHEAISAQSKTLQVQPSEPTYWEILDKYGNLITLNSKQQEFVKTASSGKSCVLIGAAGTGKTTCQRAVTQSLIQSGIAGILEAEGHKHLLSGTPGIVICAYTRRAVANIRRNMPADLQNNCITIHKLLEYQPVYYEVTDESTGESKTTMKFEATRHAGNPLPSSIRVIIFEESSMIGTDLHQEVINACPHPVQFIYLGDIQQLPPVFGPAILGFKLLELPVVELTEVYRQALESPIISLAHRILSAKPLHLKEFDDWKKEGQMTIRGWKKKISPEEATITLGAVFKQFHEKDLYDPEEDIILIPFNKSCGTEELNRIIANHLARHREETTWQIIAGFMKVHLSVGDRVLYEKEDAVVVKIEHNPSYAGVMPIPESKTLDYWGHDPVIHTKTEDDSDDAMDFLLAQTAAAEKEDRVKKSSHRVTVKLTDSEQEVTIDSAGDINSLLLGYALTVHKAQGSEWRKVFFCLHQSHATMVQRELLYTAVTRAREELYIICEPESFVKGILSQRVKGNTLEEKAQYFMGKLDKQQELLS